MKVEVDYGVGGALRAAAKLEAAGMLAAASSVRESLDPSNPNHPVRLEPLTAQLVAEQLEAAGLVSEAAQTWMSLALANPYDRSAREKFGDLALELRDSRYSLGSIARSRLILQLIGISFPTERLSNAYFQNLERLLSARSKSPQDGRIVLGLGTGRCGSTTLCAAMASLANACATHENPPFFDWQPAEEQVQFHFKRLRLLSHYFDWVFDVSHSWLNVLERVFDEFPHAKAFGLCRETESCVASFVAVKRRGNLSFNHWAAPGHGIWNTTTGDTAYPSYPLDPQTTHPDVAKAAMIRRYVMDYNCRLRLLADRHPRRLMLVATESLSDEQTIARMSEFLGSALVIPATPLNAGTTADGRDPAYLF